MIQQSMGLSKLLSQFMVRINSRVQRIDSNQFRLKNQEMINPEKPLQKDAVTVTLGEKTISNATENITYDNKAAYQNRNTVRQDQKNLSPASQEPFMHKAGEMNQHRNRHSAVEEPVAEPPASTETPDFNEFKQSKFEEFKAAWGSKAGSDTYNESYDFDANGVIDMVDYLQFGQEFNSAFEGFKQAWRTSSEQADFASQFDYDDNGVIDMEDYLNFGKNWLA